MILTARDLLVENVLRVPAEARAAEYERELSADRVTAFAVFDGPTFLGLVEPAAAVAFPQRIFADLCSRAPAPVAETASLEEILQAMDRGATTVLPVAARDGRFLGVVSHVRITEILLWQAEARLQGIRQLLATTVDLGSERTLDDVLQRVVDLAVQLTDARSGVLELADADAVVPRRFQARGRVPADSVLSGAGRHPAVAGAPGRPGIARRPPADHADPAPADLTPLVAPLRLRGRTLGRLVVWDKGRAGCFTGEDQILLSALADQAAIAVENARLFHSVRQQMEELRRTQGRLLQAEKLSAMGQLLASVAHELSNPLAVLVGQSELLAASLAGTPHAAQLQRVSQAAQRCSRIVRNYLALARQRPPERQAVDLNTVVREALELLAYSLRVDDVEPTLALDEHLARVAADPHQLHQVIVNLVTNARDALREVPAPRRLRLATHAAGAGHVCLEVTDGGPGIPPDVQARLFEPFFTTKPTGTGLGLPLCQSIVESHRGTIEVESRPGRGTTFRVRLPVADVSPSPDAPAARDGEAPVTGKRILLVDDEAAIRELLGDILAEDQHTVESAGDGR